MSTGDGGFPEDAVSDTERLVHLMAEHVKLEQANAALKLDLQLANQTLATAEQVNTALLERQGDLELEVKRAQFTASREASLRLAFEEEVKMLARRVAQLEGDNERLLARIRSMA